MVLSLSKTTFCTPYLFVTLGACLPILLEYCCFSYVLDLDLDKLIMETDLTIYFILAWSTFFPGSTLGPF